MRLGGLKLVGFWLFVANGEILISLAAADAVDIEAGVEVTTFVVSVDFKGADFSDDTREEEEEEEEEEEDDEGTDFFLNDNENTDEDFFFAAEPLVEALFFPFLVKDSLRAIGSRNLATCWKKQGYCPKKFLLNYCTLLSFTSVSSFFTDLMFFRALISLFSSSPFDSFPLLGPTDVLCPLHDIWLLFPVEFAFDWAFFNLSMNFK